MFKVSSLNPQDTTLDEIHGIQEKLFKEESRLSWEEKRRLFDKQIKEFEQRHACRLKIFLPDEVLVR